MPALPLWKLILLGIRSTCRPKQQKVIAPQPETKGFLRSREVELVDIERLEMPVAIRLTTVTAQVLDTHNRTLLRL
jgi:hypothetical protein